MSQGEPGGWGQSPAATPRCSHLSPPAPRALGAAPQLCLQGRTQSWPRALQRGHGAQDEPGPGQPSLPYPAGGGTTPVLGALPCQPAGLPLVPGTARRAALRRGLPGAPGLCTQPGPKGTVPLAQPSWQSRGFVPGSAHRRGAEVPRGRLPEGTCGSAPCHCPRLHPLPVGSCRALAGRSTQPLSHCGTLGSGLLTSLVGHGAERC